MPSEKSLQAMEVAFVPRLSKRAHDYCDLAAEVADRLIAQAVAERNQQIMGALEADEFWQTATAVQTIWLPEIRSIVMGETDGK